MKKFIIIVSLGISLIIIGSLVTASEISSWTFYDLDENVANLPKAKVETEISFEEIESDKVRLITYPMYNDDKFGLDYEDNIEYFIGNMGHRNMMMKHSNMMGSGSHNKMMFQLGNVNMIESDNQKPGTFRVSYEYIDGFGIGRCEFESVTIEENDAGYEYSQRRHNRKNRRQDYFKYGRDYDIELDTTFLYVTCNDVDAYFRFNDLFNMSAKERIKAILKNKQLPTPFGEYTIIVNPQDKDKISY